MLARHFRVLVADSNPKLQASREFYGVLWQLRAVGSVSEVRRLSENFQVLLAESEGSRLAFFGLPDLSEPHLERRQQSF